MLGIIDHIATKNIALDFITFPINYYINLNLCNLFIKFKEGGIFDKYFKLFSYDLFLLKIVLNIKIYNIEIIYILYNYLLYIKNIYFQHYKEITFLFIP